MSLPALTFSALTAEIADSVGSLAEARWIVEAAVGRAVGSLQHAGGGSGEGSLVGTVDPADVPPGEIVPRSVAPDLVAPAAVVSEARHIASRRSVGEPLQYLLGFWAFRSLELAVDPRVLIPRPETEQVVEVALCELTRLAGCRVGIRAVGAARDPESIVIADLGTGSGAIALSIALEGPNALRSLARCPIGDAQTGKATSPAGPVKAERTNAPVELVVWATDISNDALDVARSNLETLVATGDQGLLASRRINLVQGSWFDALPDGLLGRLDLVVSNPPYVSAAEWADLDPIVRDHEPYGALVPDAESSSASGFEAIAMLINHALPWLAVPGALVIELAPHQADDAVQAAIGAGFQEAEIGCDLAGRARALVARAL